MELDLKELVELRNKLLHHFIDQHDLRNLGGCRDANDALLADYRRIDEHFEQLRGLAENFGQMWRPMAEFFQSDVFLDWVANGINPDGTVDWSAAVIVKLLRNAAGNLTVAGWTPLASAERWITERLPEQLPGKYGCSSWRQVVHESRQFDPRYRDVDGRRAACYRPKSE